MANLNDMLVLGFWASLICYVPRKVLTRGFLDTAAAAIHFFPEGEAVLFIQKQEMHGGMLASDAVRRTTPLRTRCLALPFSWDKQRKK